MLPILRACRQSRTLAQAGMNRAEYALLYLFADGNPESAAIRAAAERIRPAVSLISSNAEQYATSRVLRLESNGFLERIPRHKGLVLTEQATALFQRAGAPVPPLIPETLNDPPLVFRLSMITNLLIASSCLVGGLLTGALALETAGALQLLLHLVPGATRSLTQSRTGRSGRLAWLLAGGVLLFLALYSLRAVTGFLDDTAIRPSAPASTIAVLGILFSILSSLALAVVGQRSLALPLIIRAGENQRTAGLLVLALFAIAGSFFGMHGIDRLAAVLMLLLLARQAWPLFRRMLASRKSGNVHRPLAEWLAARAMRDRRRYLLAWLSALLEEKTLDRADIEKMIAHELASHDFHIAGNILVRLDADGGSTAQLDGLLGELLLEGRIRMVGNRFIAYPRRTPCS